MEGLIGMAKTYNMVGPDAALTMLYALPSRTFRMLPRDPSELLNDASLAAIKAALHDL